MSSGYARLGANANRRHEVSFVETKGASPKRIPLRDAIAAAVREAFNSKALTQFTGTSVRAAQNIMNGTSTMSLETFIGALHSPAGPAILDAAMKCNGDVPPWYADQQIILRIQASEQRAEEARKELQELRRGLSRR